MDSKKFLDASEVAAEFGLDAQALQALVDAGELRALADRGTWKYRRDELQQLADSGRILAKPASDTEIGIPLHQQDENVSYIELDEEALEEAKASTEGSEPGDWFVPSDASEMVEPVEMSSSDLEIFPADSSSQIPVAVEQSSSDVDVFSGGSSGDVPVMQEQSSSDVAIFPGPESAESAEPTESLAESALSSGSDSDVRIAEHYEAPRPEDSGIVLDFNLDAGATVSSSGSSLRLPQTVPGAIEGGELDFPVEDDSAWEMASEPAADASGIALGEGEDLAGESSLNLGGDSAIFVDDIVGSHLGMPEESGIMLDEGSVIQASPANPESGISLGLEDSGISLEDSHRGGIDSGIALSADDSGLALSGGESGISLGMGDSGISLTGGDSGLSLEDDSGIPIGNQKTVADLDLSRGGDKTQTIDLDDSEVDSSFEINLDDADATAELLLDDDDADSESATIIRKGAPAPGSLSAAFELDDSAEVEDLEISQDLDATLDDEVEDLSEEEDIFEASEDTFSGDEVEATGDDDDYLEAEEPEARKKPAGPREPSWGAGMAIGLVACSLFLAANSLIIWAGISTMWTGADDEGPGGMLVQTFGDLIK